MFVHLESFYKSTLRTHTLHITSDCTIATCQADARYSSLERAEYMTPTLKFLPQVNASLNGSTEVHKSQREVINMVQVHVYEITLPKYNAAIDYTTYGESLHMCSLINCFFPVCTKIS